MKKSKLHLAASVLAVGLVSCSNINIESANASDFRAAQEAEYQRGNVSYRVNGNVSETTLINNKRVSQLKATAIDGIFSARRLPPHLSGLGLDYLRHSDFFFEGGCTTLVVRDEQDPQRVTNINLSHPTVNAYLFQNTGYFDWSDVDLSGAVLMGQSLAEAGKQWKVEGVIGDAFQLPTYSDDVFDTYVSAMFKYAKTGDRSSATFNLDYAGACDVFTAVKLAIWMGENGYDFRQKSQSPEVVAKRNLFREEIENVVGEDFAMSLVFDYVPSGIKSVRFNLDGTLRPEANNYELDEDEIPAYEFNVSLTLDSVDARQFPDNAPSGYHGFGHR